MNIFFHLHSQSSATQLSLEDGPRVENIQYKYKIYNNGPSTIKEFSLALQIPLFYIPKPNYLVKLVEFDEIGISGFYANKVYDVTWNKDDKIWLQSHSGGIINSQTGDNMNTEKGFDSSKLGFDYELNADRTQEYDTLGQSNHRRKRSPWNQNPEDYDNQIVYRAFNQYTGSVDEYTASYRMSVDKEDPTLINLPKNRTIFLDCSLSEETDECIEAQFTIHNFRPGSEPITLNLNFSLDLTKFGKNINFFALLCIHIKY